MIFPPRWGVPSLSGFPNLAPVSPLPLELLPLPLLLLPPPPPPPQAAAMSATQAPAATNRSHRC